MSISKKIAKAIKNPLHTFDNILGLKIFRILPDRIFLKFRYYFKTGRVLNLKQPKLFNEKMQYLKLHNRQPIMTDMVDKYASKEIVSGIIGNEYVIPALGVWDNFEQIDFSLLPERFVLKTTQDCGGVVICKNKETFDYENAKKKLEWHLTRNYYYHCREWPYKNVPHRILAEEFVENPGEEILVVYKVFCMNGEPQIIQVIQGDKSQNETIDYFDTSWVLLDLHQNFPNSSNHIKKPDLMDEMIEKSRILSNGFPFIRIDWYIINNHLKFSEYTFYSDAGFEKFYPDEWDKKLGDLIDLSAI